jgi:hypothetical protein
MILLELQPDLASLFDLGSTYAKSAQRRLLRRRPLCQWLQLFYLSHAEIRPVLLKRLHRLSGVNATPREFRRMLEVALAHLQAVGFITRGEIEAGATGIIVVVQMPSSPSKIRYLEGRRARFE